MNEETKPVECTEEVEAEMEQSAKAQLESEGIETREW